ncbi:hypothetical protein EV714DRAFT_256069 [Schizophyllum commune]
MTVEVNFELMVWPDTTLRTATKGLEHAGAHPLRCRATMLASQPPTCLEPASSACTVSAVAQLCSLAPCSPPPWPMNLALPHRRARQKSLRLRRTSTPRRGGRSTKGAKSGSTRLMYALEGSLKDNATLRQENARILGELKNITAELQEARHQLAEQNPGHPDDVELEPPSKKARSDKGNEEAALHAGKLVTLKYMMWTPRRALAYLPGASKEPVSDGEADDEIEEEVDEEIKTAAATIVSCVPGHVRPALAQSAVVAKIRVGQRQMRSQAVEVVQSIAHDVFDVSSTDFPTLQFKNKEKRALLPMVQTLLKDNRFLYDREPKTITDRLEGYMRHACILRILRVILRGKSAVASGEAAKKARTPYADLLGIKEVTFPMIAFAATIAYFVLSCQPELTAKGSKDYKFNNFYQAQVRKLNSAHQRSGASKRRTEALLLLFNRDIFPDDHAVQRRDPVAIEEDNWMRALDAEAAEEERQREAAEAEERERRAAQLPVSQSAGPQAGGEA